MVVVQHGPAVAGRREVVGERRLPDAFREPGSVRPLPEELLQLVAHTDELAVAIAIGEGHEDRLVEATTDDLNLASVNELAYLFDRLGSVGRHPPQQRPGVVETDANAGMALQGVEHGGVGVLVDVFDHPTEVAHRLVVVEDEGERDGGSHVIQYSGLWSCQAAAGED